MRFRDGLLAAGLLFVSAFLACDSSKRSRFGDDDSGGSGGASITGTDTGCSSLADCPRWACHCNDGSLVYAQSCDNGRCGAALDPGMCPAACADFGGLASVDPLPDGGTGGGTSSGGAGMSSGGAAPPDGGSSSSSGGAAPPDDGGSSSSSGGAAPPADGGP